MLISDYITPVMLTDSTGYSPDWWNPFSWNNSTKFLVGAAIIVALGVATVLTGGASAGVAGFILAGAFKGAVISAAIGTVSGAVIGGALSAISGGNFISGAIDGAADGFMFGAISGGIGGTILRISTLSKWNPGTFGSSYESMMYHYGKHGVQTGSKFFGTGVVNYTKDAYSFAIRNASNLKYTYNYNYGNATWNSNYLPTSQGGMFDSLGKIITFWYN